VSILNNLRRPNQEEIIDLATYIYNRDYAMPGRFDQDGFTEAQVMVESATIAVFDDYVMGSPAYAGKLMLVVLADCPCLFEAFIWWEGKLHRVYREQLSHSPADRPDNSVRILPTFKGYTVDERLREFRKADVETGLEFIPFDSERGMELLEELRQEGLSTPAQIIQCDLS
jgi:hypothetical protein